MGGCRLNVDFRVGTGPLGAGRSPLRDWGREGNGNTKWGPERVIWGGGSHAVYQASATRKASLSNLLDPGQTQAPVLWGTRNSS